MNHQSDDRRRLLSAGTILVVFTLMLSAACSSQEQILVSGRMVLADGTPAAGMELRGLVDYEPAIWNTSETDIDGTFEVFVPADAPGKYDYEPIVVQFGDVESPLASVALHRLPLTVYNLPDIFLWQADLRLEGDSLGWNRVQVPAGFRAGYRVTAAWEDFDIGIWLFNTKARQVELNPRIIQDYGSSPFTVLPSIAPEPGTQGIVEWIWFQPEQVEAAISQILPTSRGAWCEVKELRSDVWGWRECYLTAGPNSGGYGTPFNDAIIDLGAAQVVAAVSVTSAEMTVITGADGVLSGDVEVLISSDMETWTLWTSLQIPLHESLHLFDYPAWSGVFEADPVMARYVRLTTRPGSALATAGLSVWTK